MKKNLVSVFNFCYNFSHSNDFFELNGYGNIYCHSFLLWKPQEGKNGTASLICNSTFVQMQRFHIRKRVSNNILSSVSFDFFSKIRHSINGNSIYIMHKYEMNFY